MDIDLEIKDGQMSPDYSGSHLDDPVVEGHHYGEMAGVDYVTSDIANPAFKLADRHLVDQDEQNLSEESVCSSKSTRSVSFDLPIENYSHKETPETSEREHLSAKTFSHKDDVHNQKMNCDFSGEGEQTFPEEAHLSETDHITDFEKDVSGVGQLQKPENIDYGGAETKADIETESPARAERSRAAHDLVRNQERLLGDLCSLKRDLGRVDDELKSLKKHLTFNMSYGLYGNQSFYTRGQGGGYGGGGTIGDMGNKSLRYPDLERETAEYLNRSDSVPLSRPKSLTRLWHGSDWGQGHLDDDIAFRKPMRNYYSLNSDGDVEYKPFERIEKAVIGRTYTSTRGDCETETGRMPRSTLRTYGSSSRSLSARSRARSTSPPRLSGLEVPTRSTLSYGARFASTDNLHNLHYRDNPTLSSTSSMPRDYHYNQYTCVDHRGAYHRRCGACGRNELTIPNRNYDYNNDFGSQTLSRIYVKALGKF